jgi:hypothetical protein
MLVALVGSTFIRYVSMLIALNQLPSGSQDLIMALLVTSSKDETIVKEELQPNSAQVNPR